MITIFHLTDPHGRLSHVQRAIERAPGHSLIAVSGDIRDWDGPATVAQIEETLAALRKLVDQAAAKNSHVAVNSGNHDDWCGSNFHEDYWLDVHEGNLHGDFSNAILNLNGEEVILTCMPWRDFEFTEWPAWLDKGNPVERARRNRDKAAQKRISEMLGKGKRWRDAKRIPWVWLHHNPPSQTVASAFSDASNVLRDWISKYQPTAVLSGHLHDLPAHAVKNLCGHLGNTLVSNPGRTLDEIRINVIQIDRKDGAWVASGHTVAEQIPTEEDPGTGRTPLKAGGIPLITDGDDVEEWLLRVRRRPK